MASPTTTAVLNILDKSAKLAIEYISYKNLKEKRKYIDELKDIRTQLHVEKSKSNDDQYDNIVESLTARLEIVLDTIELDIENVDKGGKDE